MERDWVIVAVHLSTQGIAIFWREGGRGYTRKIEEAGRWTKEEAQRREQNTERREVAVHFSEIEKVSFRAVMDDDAHRWFHERFYSQEKLDA
jgi:hypothetical protein